jgi:hypothetical protein
MKDYTLTLANSQGVVVNTWVVGDKDSENADVLYPLTKAQPGQLAQEINHAISCWGES